MTIKAFITRNVHILSCIITYPDYLVILTICYFICLLFVRCIEERREKVLEVSIQHCFVPVEKTRENNLATCLDINHL